MTTTNPTPAQQETLLPCPWCLGPAVMSGTNNGDTGDGYMWKIGCAEENDCTVQPEFYYESEQLAVTRWNTRAAVAGPVIELLSASLLHPESAEGYVRQAIEMLSAAATASAAPAEPILNTLLSEFANTAIKCHIGFKHEGPWDRCEWIECEDRRKMIESFAPAERTRVEGEQLIETEICPVCKNEVPLDSLLSYNNVPNAFCQGCVDSGKV